MSPIELLIKRCKIAAGCAWEVSEGGNKTEPQEPEVRRILRDCVKALEAVEEDQREAARTSAAVRDAGFRVGTALMGDLCLWCIECGRDSGFHWSKCSKSAVEAVETKEETNPLREALKKLDKP